MIETNKFFNTLPSVSQRINEELNKIVDDNIRLSIPAEVTDVSEYSSKQHVDVQILIGFTKPDGTTVSAPQIKKVFVKLPAGGGFKETYPLSKGNLVTLHWTHRSLNEFLDNSAREVFPDEEDRWELRDCYATVGFGSRNNNQSPDATNHVFATDSGSYSRTTTPDGNVTVVAKDVNHTANNLTYSNSSYTLNTETYTTNASNTYDVTSPQSTFNGNVGINGVLQITSITGYGGASSASSDIPLSATELHADDGWSGSFATGDSRTVTVVDGIITGVA